MHWEGRGILLDTTTPADRQAARLQCNNKVTGKQNLDVITRTIYFQGTYLIASPVLRERQTERQIVRLSLSPVTVRNHPPIFSTAQTTDRPLEHINTKDKYCQTCKKVYRHTISKRSELRIITDSRHCYVLSVYVKRVIT